MADPIPSEPPLWLRAAARSLDLALPQVPIIDMVNLNSSEIKDETTAFEGGSAVMRSALQRRNGALAEALRSIDPLVEVLEIDGDTPSNEEWVTIGSHFSNVKKIQVETGFDERWVDGSFPLNWPLELLVLSSACGELVTTPAVIDGRVDHLVLFLVSGLRFEGPNTKELVARARERAEEQKKIKASADGGKAEKDIQLIWVPEEAHNWLAEKYAGKDITLENSPPEGLPPSRMRTLEILENDAIEIFIRFALARPHVVMGLERLNIRSTHNLDLGDTGGHLFPGILAAMANLKHLELSLGNQFDEDFEDEGTDEDKEMESGDVDITKEKEQVNILDSLYRKLPPNLETFKFRGHVDLAKDSRLAGWTEAFGKPDFLPNLKSLSFVLDIGERGRKDATLDDLKRAKGKVETLLGGARARGVATEEFWDHWSQCIKIFRQVDKRWKELGADEP